MNANVTFPQLKTIEAVAQKVETLSTQSPAPSPQCIDWVEQRETQREGLVMLGLMHSTRPPTDSSTAG